MRQLLQSSERGSSLVEFALVLTLLLLLLAGAADVARAFNYYITITNASREGARFGASFPHYFDGIRNAAKQETLGSAVVLNNDDIIIDPEGGSPAQPGEPIRVSIEYDFATIMSGMLGADTITLRSSTQMAVFGYSE